MVLRVFGNRWVATADITTDRRGWPKSQFVLPCLDILTGCNSALQVRK
jgi:hypothetical protein